MKKIIGIIPARYASTRFPKKLLYPIQKKPLIQYTYENAKDTQLFLDLFVATDHEDIAKVIQKIGGNVIMTPTACLTATDRLSYVVRKDVHMQNADVIFNIQGDHPFLTKETMQKMIEAFSLDPNVEIATAVTPCTYEEAKSPHVVKCVFNKQMQALYFSRSMIPHSKNSSASYYHHLGIYAYRPTFLLQYPNLSHSPLQEEEDLEQLKFLENGHSIKVVTVTEKALGIDTFSDISIMEKRLCLANTSL